MKKKNPLAWTDDHRAREQGWKSLNLWHITCHQSIFRTKGQKILQTEETININAIINKTTEEADTSCSPLHSGKETYAEPRNEGTRECRTTKIPEESNGWMISLLMIENDIEKNGYEHGMKDTYTREPFDWRDSQETSAAARQQSEWIVTEGRITDYPIFLPRSHKEKSLPSL